MPADDEKSQGENNENGDDNIFSGKRSRRPLFDLEVLEHLEDNPRVAQEDEDNAFTLTIDLAFNIIN